MTDKKTIQKKLIKLVLIEAITFEEYTKLLKQLKECKGLEEFETTLRLRYNDYEMGE
jgi:hypothetical protein